MENNVYVFITFINDSYFYEEYNLKGFRIIEVNADLIVNKNTVSGDITGEP